MLWRLVLPTTSTGSTGDNAMTTNPNGVSCAGVKAVWRTGLTPSAEWRPQAICANLNQVPAGRKMTEASGSLDHASGATRPITHNEELQSSCQVARNTCAAQQPKTDPRTTTAKSARRLTNRSWCWICGGRWIPCKVCQEVVRHPIRKILPICAQPVDLRRRQSFQQDGRQFPS